MQFSTTALLVLVCSCTLLQRFANSTHSFNKPGASPSNANVNENQPVGTIVNVAGDTGTNNLRVNPTGTYTWTMTGTGCTANFDVQVDANTREATFKTLAILDAETTTTYTCTITVADGLDTTSQTLTITVNNLIDVTPAFTAASYSCTMAEEQAAGTALPTGCRATYTDSEVDAFGDVVTCTLSGADSSYFSVDHNTASKLCTPKLAVKLDFETVSSATLSFNVEATDTNGLKASSPVTLTVTDINDNTPVCPVSSFSVTKTETFIGEILSGLTCTDKDSAAFGQVEYSLMDAASSRYFAIDASSGRVTNTVPLDFDTASKSNYTTLVLKVADKGTPTALSTSVTVSISITAENDNTPQWGTFTPAYTDATTPINTVSESATVGVTAFTAVATDLDFGVDGILTYSIQSARGSDLSNVISAFEINPTSGVVSVKAAGVLDRESYGTVDITVLANDNPSSTAPLTITRVVRVTITDANEFPPRYVPASGAYTATVAEAAAAGTLVQTIDVTDPDATGTTPTCSIVGGNTGNIYRVRTADSKVIEVNTAIEPDNPTNHPATSILTVACADTGLTSTATVTVSVSLTNDNAPTLSLPAGNTITIPENQVLGKIADVTAGDNDGGADGTITCSVTPIGTFALSGACDELRLIQAVDRETTASYPLVLTVQDGGSPVRSATVSVTVTLTDVNDNSPVCTPSTYYATIAETSGAVSPLTTLTCSDADTHGIYYSSNTTHFTVDSSTGVVSYTGGADYDTGPSSYDVIVYAVDNNDANKFTQATVRVTITNVNEATPTFVNKTISVAETIYGGQLVTSFTATDSDKAPDNIQSYRIVSGDATNYFSINNNGDLFVRSGRTLDYETLAPSSLTWTLVIEAVDGGSTPLTGAGTLTITLTDTNDNPPIFSQSTYTATVAEGTATAPTGITVAATDADADPTNDHAKMHYSFSPTSTFFTVGLTTGVVTKTAANLDYDTNPSVSIPVLAIDNLGAGPNTATATVVITVTDTNTAPTCSIATKSITKREDTSIGTEIWNLVTPTAICSDADTSQSLRYSLGAGSDTHFSIHPTTGSLKVTGNLNFENTTTHFLSVLATDNHATPATATIQVTVAVTDVNEFNPNCTAPTSASLQENAATAAVYSVTTCTDTDTSSTSFTYGINGGVPFVVSAAGVVSNSAVLDYEASASKSFVVEVTVADNAPSIASLRTSTYTTTVTLVPLNDNAPVFTTNLTVYADIREDRAVGTGLSLTTAASGGGSATSIAATDADIGVNSHSDITFSIFSGNGRGWFQIGPTSGVISVAASMDREASSSETLVIRATDGGGTTAAADVNVVITITDYNDNKPVFPTAHFTVNISEGNTPPNNVVDFSAASALTDADIGANAALNLTIQSGVTASPNNEFAISGKTLQTSKSFDLPVDSTQYVVTLIATDGGLPQLTGTATVTVNIVEVNKVAPTFASGSDTISVSESTAIGASLYNVSATDTDVGLGGSVSYSLPSTSPTTTLFTASNNGMVSLQNAIDYDTLTNKVYQLYVVASDSGTPVKSSTFTLTVSITDANDNDPVFDATNEFTKSFAENVGSGFDVTTVIWSDADSPPAGTVTCSIFTQTTPAIFSIGTNNCKLTTSANPDREARGVHTVEVQLTDGGVPARTKRAVFTFTITDLNDNSPTFADPSIITSVVENLAAGAAVTTVSATDIDAGTNADFEYSIISNDGAGDHGNFTIGATTGIITTALVLNREQKSFYSLRVLAIDKGTTPLTGTAVVNVTVIDVNDNTPAWSGATPYTATVSEGASIGTLVKQVTATDADSTFGVLTYSIIAGDTLSLFRINSATGRVETAKSTGLDRESVGIWNLTLRVQDNGSPTPLSADAELRVTVTDINEFAPSWMNNSYNFRIIENSVVNSPVGSVVATDNDDGPLNNKITYSIDAFIQGNAYFAIDPNTAAISVSVAALDRETLDTYLLRIVAWDGATPSKTATNCLTVTIYITDANDHDPVPGKAYYNASVYENATVGFNVLTVSGSDSDIGENGRLTYLIDTNNTDGALADNFFTLDANTGLMTVKSALDRETTPFYHFPILVRDNGVTPRRTASASVYIIVLDVNDVAPVLSKTFYNAEVPQVDDGNMQIVTISASDPDTGTGGVVSYAWNSNTPYFHIDSTTGIVNRNTLNTVESYRIYTQDVVARDQGSPQLTSAASKVRIDTFPAEDYIVMIHFSMSEADYLANLANIKTNLGKTLVGKYPDNRVGHWKYHMQGSNVVGYFYALANTVTDNVTYISVDKEFVPYTDLLAFWRFDSAGTPTDILQGSDFTSTPIVKVEPYPQAAGTPWYETWWGILLLTLAAVAALALLAAAVYGLYVCISSLCMGKPPSVPVSQPVKPPPVRERQILELNKDKHPRHHPKPKGRYLIKDSQGQNKGAQPEAPTNRTNTPRADFDQQKQNNGRVSPTGSLDGDANLDF